MLFILNLVLTAMQVVIYIESGSPYSLAGIVICGGCTIFTGALAVKNS